MVRFVFSCLLLWIHFSSSAQLIVNVENSRIHSDTTGWAGSMGTTFSFVKNVQEIINLNANVHLQYKTRKDLYLFLANYNLLRGNQQALSNNMFYHIRYNRKLGKLIRWEAFTQWQQNAITNIDLRFLAGTGPRFKLYDQTKFKLYAATLAMYEYERDKEPATVQRDIRSDTYVTFTYQPTAYITLTSTTFYQPLFKMIKDFRVLNQIVMNVKATKRLAIVTSWDYLYDAYPAAGIPNINYVISNGFSYTF